MADQKLVTVEQFDNPHRADMAKLALEEAGIGVYLENRLIVETDWLLSLAIGSIRLQVNAEHQERAQEILATIKPWSIDDEPDASFEDVSCLNCGAAMPEHLDVCSECGWSYSAADSPDEPANEAPQD